MFKSIINYILTNVFKINTQTTDKEINDNSKYARIYQNIDDINFNAIFSNKLANYTISDSTMNIDGDNKRTELLNKTATSMWKKSKKITSMAYGYGGLIIVPYVKGGKIYYNLVPQDRLTIDETDGELITGATVLAERKVIKGTIGEKTYLRWTNYKVENNNITITQQYSDEKGNKIPAPDFWKDIQEVRTITNVDRVLFGYLKSPINNRKANDKYGVPITYGCDATILEIKTTLKQIVREYELKECFVGVDYTMFQTDSKGKITELPSNGLYKTFNFDEGENKFNVFDPAFRPYTERLQELYKRLEHEIGTSYGILSEVDTFNATATEIKRSMYDTFVICDDMRTNIEKCMDDFFYACNVLANAYNLSANGEYKVVFDWSYSLLEDTQTEWQQMTYANSKGIVSDVELRQWLNPKETLEESKKVIEEIKAQQPSIEDMLGTKE
ncbi:MAG: phage portal protein [Clostridia bacterium]|nr:phage portal protein [Clostridia bacterium]